MILTNSRLHEMNINTINSSESPRPAGLKGTHILSILTILHVLFLFCLGSTSVYGENWPAWRGPRGDGTSLETSAPIKWSNTENVAWKTRIPGKGHASPIVFNDAVFVVTAIEDKQQRVLLRLDLATGRVLWQRTVLEAPPEGMHKLNSLASSTPATDGKYVYVSFLDNDKMFVAAYDFSGKRVWAAAPGVFSSVHGYCASPALFKDKVIINGDHDGPGYLVALSKETGKTIWKTPRPNNTRSYCPFLIRTINGRDQLVLSGSKCVASYDPDTGEQHWIIDGPTEQYVASLVYNGEMFFMTCGFPERYMQAIDPDGTGNVTDTHVVWQRKNRTDCSYVPSPIAFGAYFLVVSDRGVASCLDAKTGKVLWQEQFPEKHSASLTSAGGLVYFLSDSGVMTIVRPGPKYDVVSTNELGEETYASPAISQGRMLIRGLDHLYCIKRP